MLYWWLWSNEYLWSCYCNWKDSIIIRSADCYISCYGLHVFNSRVKLTLMTNEAIFFPLYSTILHSLAVGSDDVKGGGDRDLKLKHNYTAIHVKTWYPVTLISHYQQNINGLLLCFIVNHSIELSLRWTGLVFKIQNRHHQTIFKPALKNFNTIMCCG